ncbi:hypothetical protein thalar_00011 [Litoreibacter arenae DSM 19593]|uniref:Uncharacterized protein n=1 Tax=Litoreibacter arenae DSM 19593 TaxID=1123360 RepID=S9QJ28_9RHOB|nr:hypothetical protein thalar_00011 [Litoreibacter arenae DSM 19593]
MLGLGGAEVQRVDDVERVAQGVTGAELVDDFREVSDFSAYGPV